MTNAAATRSLFCVRRALTYILNALLTVVRGVEALLKGALLVGVVLIFGGVGGMVFGYEFTPVATNSNGTRHHDRRLRSDSPLR